MRKRGQGGLLMLLGVLCLVAAGILTARNMAQEHASNQAVEAAYQQLTRQMEHQDAQATKAPPALKITDTQGEEISWPVQEDGTPMAWPVDEEGQPAPQVMDALGKIHYWPVDADTGEAVEAADSWQKNNRGELLPYASDEEGLTIPWMQNAAGELMAPDALAGQWDALVNELTANLRAYLSQPDFIRNPGMEMPVTFLEEHAYIGIIDIPSQDRSLPVMSEWSYDKLHIAPCRYTGSLYKGDLILAGHNNTGHFSPIKNMQPGDEVFFTDVDGNVFVYSVAYIEIIGENDVEAMLAGSEDRWDLTMFTCSHGAAKRTTVRCVLESYRCP